MVALAKHLQIARSCKTEHEEAPINVGMTRQTKCNRAFLLEIGVALTSSNRGNPVLDGACSGEYSHDLMSKEFLRPASVWVIVPAFEEASIIGTVVTQLMALGHTVLVVDDGSRDQTATVATGCGAHVVRHPVNLGQGAALQTGIEFALWKGAAHIITFDADGQHRASDIGILLAPLLTGQADFTLGSRQLGMLIGAPRGRRLLLSAATLFMRVTTGLKLTDAHNGLRGMTRRGASAIRLRQNRMAHASEIISQIAASKLCFVEVPVTVDYNDYSLAKGQRSFDAVRIVIDLAAGFMRR
jgi:glycosyltransferase involved in cell wall biosynthesis